MYAEKNINETKCFDGFREREDSNGDGIFKALFGWLGWVWVWVGLIRFGVIRTGRLMFGFVDTLYGKENGHT